MPLGSEQFVQKLEDRGKQIELLSVSDRGAAGLLAAVYVPTAAREHFIRKIEKYRDEVSKGGRPKNEALVARVDQVALGAFDTVFTDDVDEIPEAAQSVWWEVWLRTGERPTFESFTGRHAVTVSLETLTFPERDVVLAFGTRNAIGRCVIESGSVAEIRLAKDTPSVFLNFTNDEQQDWAGDVAQRVTPPGDDMIAVCILDSGVTRQHILIEPLLDAHDVHKYDPNWPDGDSATWNGHGTAMAGLSLYGDLFPLLHGTGDIHIGHRLEIVKMLAHDGQEHEPRLYGAITRESATRPEVTKPFRRRVHCMAVSSASGTNQGRPSSWSAALDQLTFGTGTTRLFVVSTGNIRQGITAAGYPTLNDIEPVENPAQSWNALAVGAYTQKQQIADTSFAGWAPIAPVGAIAPCSRTSVSWERRWPIKPDVVFEGGNHAHQDTEVDTPDDLSLLTTHYRPLVRQFQSFGDTSAAASLGARFSAQILNDRPNAWNETVRGLVVHSADWTPLMQAQLDASTNETQRLAVFRRYGYGVPDLRRAIRSSLNDATIVSENTLRPLHLANGRIKSKDMNLHMMPWPADILAGLGETLVQLRVTLSYFIEPNPGERGWKGRYRYASHGLRFALKRRLEELPQFRARINQAVQMDEEDLIPTTADDEGWTLGRIRDVGSVHSDSWIGSAAELRR
ncbi:MAG: S8 family peptidase, partial [Acidobacteria bacterium]|nr:S8 family peptidase [Acidobacteriota bacterium]